MANSYLAKKLRRRTRRQHRRLHLESLEDRRVLAGVCVGQPDNVLCASGPDLVLDRLPSTQLRLYNASNEAAAHTFDQPADSLTINLGLFDDTLTIDSSVATLPVDLKIDGHALTDRIIFDGDIEFAGHNVTVIGELIEVRGTVLSTRHTDGDSGNIDFTAHTIEVETGARLLADVLPGVEGQAGAVSLKAETRDDSGAGVPIVDLIGLALPDAVLDVQSGAEIRGGEVALTANYISQTSVLPLPTLVSVRVNGASVSINGATVHGENVTISAAARDDNVFESQSTVTATANVASPIVSSAIENVLDFAADQGAVGEGLSAAFKVISAASVVVRESTATVSLNDATIVSSGNVTITSDTNVESEAEAGGGIDPTQASATSDFGKNPPLAVGVSHAASNSQLDLTGSTSITATGNVTVASTAASKSIASGSVVVNAGRGSGSLTDDENTSDTKKSFGISVGVANSSTTAKTTVADGVVINSDGTVVVRSDGNVKNDAETRTAVFLDGSFGIAVSVGTDKTDVQTTVNGHINAGAQSIENSGGVDVPLTGIFEGINTETDIITIPGHGLTAGQEVIYEVPQDPADPTKKLEAIGGLIDGDLLRIRVINEDQIQLVRGVGIVLDATRVSRTNPASTQSIAVRDAVEFQPDVAVDADANTITFAAPHGFVAGQQVEYFLGDDVAEPIPGLENEDSYYTLLLSPTVVRLATDDPGHPAALRPPVAIDGQDLFVLDLGAPTRSDTTATFDPTGETDGSNAEVFPDQDIIGLEFDHEFTTGQRVQYTSGGGTAIGGLADGEYFVIRVDRSQLQLAATFEDAEAGRAVDLTDAEPDGTTHRLTSEHLHFLALEREAIDFSPTAAVGQDAQGSTLTLPHDHGLETGDVVIYRTDPTFRQRVPLNKIAQVQLPATVERFDSEGTLSGGDPVVDLDTNQIFFRPQHAFYTGQRVTYSTSGGNPLGGLADGADYFVIANPDSVDRLQLAATRADALAGVAIELGAGGSGADHSLSALAIDLDDDMLVIPNHGFESGQRLQYTHHGGTPIGGLTDRAEYFVVHVNEHLIKLSERRADVATETAVDLTPGASGEGQYFLSDVAVLRFDASWSEPVVDLDNDTIELPAGHGLAVGDEVVYRRGDGVAIGGLDNDQTYKIGSVTGTKISLTDLDDNPIDLGEGAEGGLLPHTLTAGSLKFEFQPLRQASVDDAAGTIWRPGHGFEGGETVTYLPGAETPLGGLTANEEYLVLFDPAAPDVFQLADPSSPSLPLALTQNGATGVQGFERPATGTLLDPSISGLRNNETYYVVKVDNRSIRLASSPAEAIAAEAIDLTLQDAQKTDPPHRLVFPSDTTPGINVLSTIESENTSVADTGIGGLPDLADLISGDAAWDPKTASAVFTGASGFLKVEDRTAASVSGSVSVNAFDHDAVTTIGGTAVLRSHGDVNVNALANQKSGVNVIAGVSTADIDKNAGGDKNFAGAIAVGVGAYDSNSQALVADGATIDARQTISVTSDIQYNFLFDEFPFVPSRFALRDPNEGDLLGEISTLLGGMGGVPKIMNMWASTRGRAPEADVTLTASIGISDYENHAEAVIGAGANINQNPLFHDDAQAVSVDARISHSLINVAGVLQLDVNVQGFRNLIVGGAAGKRSSPISLFGNQAKTLGLGGSVLSQAIDNTTVARIDRNARVRTGIDGSLNVTATEALYSFDFAQTGGDSGKIGVAGSFSYVEHRGDTLAHVASGVQLLGGPVSVKADSQADVINLTGAVQAAREVGIGVSVGITELDRKTVAVVGNRRTADDMSVGSDGTSIEAASLQIEATAGGTLWSIGVAGAIVSDLAGQDSEDDRDPFDPPNVSVGVSGVGLSQRVTDVTQAYLNDDGEIATGFVRVPDGGETTTVPIPDGGISIDGRNKTKLITIGGALTLAIDEEAVSGGSKTAVGVAGAFARNTLDLTTEALLVGARILETPALAVRASTDEARVLGVTGGVAIAAARSDGTSASVAFAGSVSLNRVSGRVAAELEHVELVAAGDITVAADDKTVIDAVTIGGAGAGASSSAGSAGAGALGGALAFNYVDVEVVAGIAGSQIGPSPTSSVDVAATSDARILGVAGGFAISVADATGSGAAAAASVGAGVAVNEIGSLGRHATEAYLENSVVDVGGDVSVTAVSTTFIQALAIGGAGAGAGSTGSGFVGAFSGAGAGTGNLIHAEISAAIRQGSDVTAGGDVQLSATDASRILATSGAVSLAVAAGTGGGGSGTGAGSVGVSIAVNEISNTTQAAIATSSLVTAGGSILVSAQAEPTVDRSIEFSKDDVDPSSDTITITGHGLQSGDRVRYEGSDTANPITGLVSGTTYYVVRVDDNTVGLAITKEDAIAGTRLVIPPLLAGTSGSHRLDVVGARIQALSIGGSGAGAGSTGDGVTAAVAGAGAAAVNQIDNTVVAMIDGGDRAADVAGVRAGGDVRVSASDTSTIVADAGGVAAAVAAATGTGGGTGAGSAGIGLAFNRIGSGAGQRIEASIHSSVAADRDVVVATQARNEIDALAIGGAVAGAGTAGTGTTGAFAGAGAGTRNTIDATVVAEISGGADVQAGRDVHVTVDDQSAILADAGGVALSAAIGTGGMGATGSGALGAAVVINQIGKNGGYLVRAAIDLASVAAANDITVDASSTAVIDALAIGGAIAGSGSASGGLTGALAGAGAGIDNRIQLVVEAVVDGPSQVQAGGDVRVTATDASQTSGDAGGVSLALAGTTGSGGTGAASVGASVVVNDINNGARAAVAGGSLVNAAGAIRVAAEGHSADDRELSFEPDSVTSSSHTIFLADHKLATGDRVRYETDGTPLGGLVVGTEYYAVRVDANTIQLATTREEALRDEPPVIAVDGTGADANHRLITKRARIKALAIGGSGAGAGSGGNGITAALAGAGAGVINAINNVVAATIDGGLGTGGDAGVRAGTSIEVTAEDNSAIVADAGGVAVSLAANLGTGATAAGSVGIGTAINEIGLLSGHAVKATIESDVAAGDNILVHADSTAAVDALAIGGAGAAAGTGGVGFTGAIAAGGAGAGNTIRQTVEAAVRDADLVAETGRIEVAATDRSKIHLDAGGGALAVAVTGVGGAAGSLSVGAAIAKNIIENRVIAVVADATVTAHGDIDVGAASSAEISSVGIGAAAAVSISVGGGVSGSGAAAGVFATNDISNEIDARIVGNSATGGRSAAATSQAGSVHVTADDQAKISVSGVGGAMAVTGTTGVSASVAAALVTAENTIANRTIAEVADAIIDTGAGGVDILARSDSEIQSVGVAAALSVSISFASLSFSGGGAFATNTIANTIAARLDANDAAVRDDVRVTADDGATIHSFTGAFTLAVGAIGASVGGSINTNQVDNTVIAELAGTVTSTSGEIHVVATSTAHADALAVITSVAVGGAGGAGAGGGSTSTIGGEVAAEIKADADLRARAIQARAVSDQTANADVTGVAISGGIIVGAIGISIGEAVIDGTTRATLRGTVHGQDLLIGAANSGQAGSTTVAVAGGAGLGGVVSTNSATAKVEPTISATADGAQIGSAAEPMQGDVVIRATGLAEADATATGVAFTVGVAVGLTYANAIVNPTINAAVQGDSIVVADGSVVVQSLHNVVDEDGTLVRQDVQSRADATTGSGGLLNGDAGAVSVANATPQLDAAIGSAADVTSQGDVIVLAESFVDMDAFAESTAVGVISVGSAEAFGNADGQVTSRIDGTVNAGDASDDRLVNMAVAWHRATTDAGAFSIGIGGGGAAAPAVVEPIISATVGANANVQAAGDVYTLAIAETSATPRAEAGALIPICNDSVPSWPTCDAGDGGRSNPTLQVDIGTGATLAAGGGNAMHTFVDQSIVPDNVALRDLAPKAIASLGNVAPLITSPAEANVSEGNTLVLTVNATDADGDPLTLSLIPGDDAALFTLGGTGELHFNSAPVFETGDEADNEYQLTVKADDGRGGVDTQTITVNVLDGSPIRLVPGAQPSGDDSGVGLVGLAEIQGIAESAVARWSVSGLSEQQQTRLGEVEYRVGDLSDGHIAAASGNLITIDRDANAYGWFVDPTPGLDEEFTVDNSTAWIADDGDAAGGIDLLTVLLHELGHVIGLHDVDDPDDLMHRYIAEGRRRVPATEQAADAEPGGDEADEVHYVTSDDLGDHDSLRNRGANYTRFVADQPGEGFTGIASSINVAATVAPNIRINLGSGSRLQSGAGQDVVIRVESTHIVRAIGGGLDGIAAPIGVVDARAEIGGSVDVFLGGTIVHDGDLVLELHTINEAVAIGEALAIGPAGGTGVSANAIVTPTIRTFVSPDSNITVGGDFAIRTLSEGSAVAETRGIAGSLLLSVGLSKSQASFQPTISTFIGAGATINAGGDITVETLHNVDRDGNPLHQPTRALAEASAGALVGVGAGVGAVAAAENSPVVTAYVDDGAQLTAGPGSTITVRALADNRAEAVARGLAVTGVGALSVGATEAEAESSGTTAAWLDGDVLQGGTLMIRAESDHGADAVSAATAGGLVTGFNGASSMATSAAAPYISARIRDGRSTDVSGDVVIGAIGRADSDADAQGVAAGVSAVGIGASQSESSLSPTVESSVGAGAAIDAGGDIIVRSRFNTAADGQPLPAHQAFATAGASTGASLFGTGGAEANASGNPRIDARIGTDASLAGRDIEVQSLGTTRLATHVDADLNGVVTTGSTASTLSLDAYATTELQPGASLTAGRNALVHSHSHVAVDAHLEGGAGTTLSDFFKDLFAGSLSELTLPSIAAVAGSGLDITVGNRAETLVGAGAGVLAGEAANVTAVAETNIDNQNTMTTGGVFANSATSATFVSVDSDANVRLADNALVRGETVTILADNRLDAEAVAEAIAAADVAGAFATSLATLNVGTSSDPATANVTIAPGAVVDARVIVVDAINRRATAGSGANLVANPRAQGDAGGFLGEARAHADGEAFFAATVEGRAGSNLRTSDLTVQAATTQVLVRQPETVATTLVTQVLEVVREVTEFIQEEVCEWLPGFLGAFCEIVTTAVITVVTTFEEVLVGAATFPTTSGAGLVIDDKINMNGDITGVQPVDGLLIVHADGSIDPASNVAATVTANEVQVGDIDVSAPVKMAFLVPRGELKGNPRISISSVPDLTVVNHSNRDLVFSDITAADDSDSEPDFRFQFATGQRYEIGNAAAATGSLDITNHGAGDVVFTKPISSLGGTIDVSNHGGGIVATDPAVYLEAADAGYVNLQSAGDIGSISAPFDVRLIRNKFTSGGSPAISPAELIAGSDGAIYLNVTGILNATNTATGDPVDPTETIDGFVLNLAAAGHLEATIAQSYVLEVTADASGGPLAFDQVFHPTSGSYQIYRATSETADVNLTAAEETIAIGLLTGMTGFHPANAGVSRGFLAAPAGTVALTSEGPIQDGNVDAAAEIEARAIHLMSLCESIGASDNPLDINATGPAGLTVSAPLGVWLADTEDGLNVASVVATDGPVQLAAADRSTSGQDIVLGPGAVVRSGTADVELLAGDDLLIDVDAAIEAATTISLEGDIDDADLTGSHIEANGQLTANLVEVATGDDDDTVLLAARGSAARVTVATGPGDDAVNAALSSSLVTVDGGAGDDLVTAVLAGPATGVAPPLPSDTLLTAVAVERTEFEQTAGGGGEWHLDDGLLTGDGVRLLDVGPTTQLVLTLGPLGAHQLAIGRIRAAAAIFTPGGGNTVTIGGSPATLSEVDGNLQLAATGGDNLLVLDDSASAAGQARPRHIGFGIVRGPDADGDITFDPAEFANIDLLLGPALDDVTFTAAGTFRMVDGGPGSDQFTVQGITTIGVLDGGADDDTLNVLAGEGTVGFVGGPGSGDAVLIDRTAATSHLTGQYQSNAAAGTASLTLDGVADIGLAFPSDVESLGVALGAGNDHFELPEIQLDTRLTITGGDGDDDVLATVTSTSGDAPAGGGLTVIGEAGEDTITVTMDGIPSELVQPHNPLAGMLAAVETLTIDNSASNVGGDWSHTNADEIRFDGQLITSALGADRTVIQAGSGSDRLDVVNQLDGAWNVTVTGDDVTLSERDVLLASIDFDSEVTIGVDELTSLVVSPDGAYVLGISPSRDKIVVLARAEGGELTLVSTHTGPEVDAASGLAISPDGNHVYVTSPTGNSVSVYDFAGGLLSLKQTLVDNPVSNAGGITALANASSVSVNAGGNRVVVTAPNDANVQGTLRDKAGIFARNSATGELTFLHEIFYVPGEIAHGLTFPDPVLNFGTLFFTALPGNNSFQIRGTGEFDPVINNTGIGAQPGQAAATADGKYLYVTSRDGGIRVYEGVVCPFCSTTRPIYLHRQTLTVDGVTDFSSIAVSPDGRRVVAASPTDDVIAVFNRAESNGQLSLGGTLEDGRFGGVGLAGPLSIAFSPDSQHVYVGSSGRPGLPGGIASYQVQDADSQPLSYQVEFSGIDSGSGRGLGVTTGDGGDTISVAPRTLNLSIDSGGGNDAVAFREAFHDTVTLGGGDDVVSVFGTRIGANIVVTGNTGRDRFEILSVDHGGTLTLAGQEDADSFYVDGSQLAATALVTVVGNDPTSSPGDQLEFYAPQGSLTSPLSPLTPNGSVTINDGGATGSVNYFLIEDYVRLGTAVLADAGGDYTISEGEPLQLDATATQVFGTPLPTASFAWDLNGDGLFEDAFGQQPNLAWQDLVDLGLGDGDQSRQIGVRVSTDTSDLSFAAATLTINNTAPDLNLSGAATATLGATYTLGFTATDPGDDRIRAWRVEWGDGFVSQLGAGTTSASHVYADVLGPVDITVTAFDEDGEHSALRAIQVVAGPVSVDAGGPYDVDEGQNLTLTASPVGSPVRYDWDLDGDGNTDIMHDGPILNLTWDQLEAIGLNGDQTISNLKVTAVYDVAGGEETATSPATTLVVNNIAPVGNLQASLPAVDEGSPGGAVQVAVTNVSDPSLLDTAAGFQFQFDFDNDGTFDTPISSTPSADVPATFLAESGTRIVRARVFDDDGQRDLFTSFDVREVLPTLNVTPASASVNEGSPLNLDLAANDPGGDPILAWIVNWGDGNVDALAGSANSASHTYADGGPRGTPRTIQVTARADAGDVNGAVNITVTDVPPTAVLSTLTPVVEEGVRDAFVLDLAVVDPGADTVTDLLIDWGDGQAQQVSGSSSSVAHTYADEGAYDVRVLEISNEDGTFYHPSHLLSVTVSDVVPTIVASELNIPSNGDVGSPVQFEALAAGTQTGDDPLSFHWTITRPDGTTVEVNAAGLPIIPAPALGLDVELAYANTAQFTPTAAGTYAVVLTVTDDDGGHVSSTPATVVVGDASPTVTVNQAAGQIDPAVDPVIHFTAVFSEPVTGLTGDEVTLSGTAGATTAEVSEVFPGDGTTYRITVRGMTNHGTVIADLAAGVAQDAAGNPNQASTSTDNLVNFGQSFSTLLPNGELRLVATDGDDFIRVSAAGADIRVQASLDGERPLVERFPIGAVTRLVIDLGEGRNRLLVDHSLAIPAEVVAGGGADHISTGAGDDIIDAGDGTNRVYGRGGNDTITTGEDSDTIFGGDGDDVVFAGGGNDRIYAQGGNDAVTAGAGNDRIYGDSGRNVMIGGAGRDAVYGGNDEDLLIGGITAYDTGGPANAAALRAILAEWSSSRPFATRQTNIESGGGLAMGHVLNDSNVTVNDNERDTLFGRGAGDWFWANPLEDVLNDLRAGDDLRE